MATKIQVWAKTNGRCWYCGKQTTPQSAIDCPGPMRDFFCVDHLISKDRGGGNDLANLVPCCRSCNSSKGTRGIEEFRELRNRQQGFVFSDAQIAFLQVHGISIPEPESDKCLFWFEKEK